MTQPPPVTDPFPDPHGTQPVLRAGAPLDSSDAAMVMIHGRGGTAQDILALVPLLGVERVACLAPQAAGQTWYPYGFMSAIEKNEPGITSAMAAIARVLETIEQEGIPPERTLIMGFSQGACLGSEYAARHARRYGGLAILSGGLIGPDDTPRDYRGDLEGTPVFLGCSDIDHHIPERRVRDTAELLVRLGADVDMRIYPGMGHTINEEELEAVRQLMRTAAARE
jgi:predicted esterase